MTQIKSYPNGVLRGFVLGIKCFKEFPLVCTAGEDKDYSQSKMHYSQSKTKYTENLNTKIGKFNEELSDSENTLYHYKIGLSQVKKEKEGLDSKLIGFESTSKDLDTLLGSQRTDKNKEGLPEFADDTITDYSRPTPSIESNISDLQNSNSSVSEHGESSSSIMSKHMIKFVKAADSPIVIKTNKVETARKSFVKYAEIVVAVSVSPVARVLTVGVPTVSGLFPIVSSIFTTASVVTPYSSQEGFQQKIKEEIARENQRMNKQLTRDAEIARLHAEEELQRMIDGLNRNNEVIAKHLQEYDQVATELTIREKIELINELVKYQDHHVKILKYQAQQSKPLSKKEQREFYMSVLRSHAGWKTRHFRGMTLEEIKEKFIPVWKQVEDFMLMSSSEEAQRVKRKGLKLDQGSSKKMKTSKDISEDLKRIMQLVHVEEVYVEALQVKHLIIN
uniref:Uncharacterized protein n=1 Tax=Tanacetum cinerariifolium TaxID=118510 RepID=A0A6L2J0W0_TANCI|nr:hypothetical protein [Tanacetum cinerariifolium]